jgi:hypothetical protein
MFPGKVVVVNCDTHKDKNSRTAVFKKFREDNDDLKIIITSKDIGGVSVSLDDRFGDRPRDVYCMGGDRRKERSEQSFWRTSRSTSKSPTEIFDIYIDGISGELEKEVSSQKKKKTMDTFIGKPSYS